MAELKLDSSLQFVKGVGPRKAEVLAKQGLATVADLLLYFPRAYLDRTNVVPINQLRVNESATIIGEVKAHGLLHGRRRRYEVILQDDTSAVTLVWFGGLRYFQRMFEKGQKWAATGRVGFFNGYQMVHPDLERLEDDSAHMVHAGRIIPVYPQTAELSKIGLTSKGIRRLTSFVFEHLTDRWADHLPERERESLGLCPLGEAVRKLHYPESRDEIEVGRRRMAFDELLLLQYLVYRNKGKKDATVKKHTYAPPGKKVSAFTRGLTFRLTADQKQVTSEISRDLQKSRPMSRLLHGEVGSGKTVVAMLAAVYAAENNLQVAFMAPTEILVEQHYRNWQEPLSRIGIESALLTSSLQAAKRRDVAERIAGSEVAVVFGTHALIYDYVSFQRLGLVIIDEQHRFGVEQRGRLYAKGEDPDLLVMTATPIPRTLALTLYGDLDISTIRTLPPGRQPVRTVWRTEEKAAKVYQYIHDEVQRGGQAYIIYPLIEKSEHLDLQNVEEAYDKLTRGIFNDLRVSLVHGRMKANERDAVLGAFRNGKVDVLLSTTVIEVGIDNPNATLLVIQHAERFGLAQLHQLRGRVGRGDKPATVVALAYQPISDLAKRRLDYFAAHRDGFEVAEADLELRGPGEIFGIRQSGAPELRMAQLGRDQDLLVEARRLVTDLFASAHEGDPAYRQLVSTLECGAERREILLGGG